jgi:hypothetical protein
MRSGKLIAKNDKYIKELCNDPNYLIKMNGEIWTCITLSGKKSKDDVWRKLAVRGLSRKGSQKKYQRVKYKTKELVVHRIVYQKYVGELSEDLMINHKDGNTLNNLELITQSINNKHRFRQLKTGPNRGNAKINQEIADAIRADRSKGYTYPELMKKYNMGKTNISYICNNKIWVK